MASKKTQTIRSRKAKKIWCQVVAPKLFGNQVLGKSYVYEAEQLIGKPLKANLMNLTGDIKSQNINIGFRVLGVKNGQGMADIWSYTIIPAHVKRMVRRKRDKIEDSFILETKDDIKIRVKPLLLTLNKSSAAVRSDIRKTVKDSLARTFKSLTLEEVVRLILMRKIQNTLKKELNKVAPMKSCDIRILERLSNKASEKAKVVVPTKEEKKPVEEKATPKKSEETKEEKE